MKKLSLILMMSILILALATGCGTGAGNIAGYLSKNYPLEDVRNSRYTDEAAYVFLMPGSVSEVATELRDKFKPTNGTDNVNDERMVLIYPEVIVDIYQEEQKTYAEIATKQYIRDHYDSGGFFKGYLTAVIIRDIFDGPRSWGYGAYPPISSRKSVSEYGKTLKQGSVGSKQVAGGGKFGGK